MFDLASVPFFLFFFSFPSPSFRIRCEITIILRYKCTLQKGGHNQEERVRRREFFLEDVALIDEKGENREKKSKK